MSSKNVADKNVAGDSLVRVSKIMADRGICSRREADAWIERGWVMVNGEIATLGAKAKSDCKIELAESARLERGAKVTILLNKPVGYVSGQPEPGYEPAVRLITEMNQFKEPGDLKLMRSHFDGLAPAGRLDIDSKGLLVFTQDGRVARDLIGEDSNVEKEYLVRVKGKIIPKGLELLRHGLELDGEALLPAKVDWINSDQLKFILTEGKKRQVRRMCELVGLEVIGLKRVRIGRIMLGKLPEGKWRFLKPDEKF